MFAPQQMIPAYSFAPATPEATPRPVAPTPRPSKRKRQGQKPAAQRKSAVASRALELYERDGGIFGNCSVTFCYLLFRQASLNPPWLAMTRTLARRPRPLLNRVPLAKGTFRKVLHCFRKQKKKNQKNSPQGDPSIQCSREGGSICSVSLDFPAWCKGTFLTTI